MAIGSLYHWYWWVLLVVVILNELVLHGGDLEIVIADMFYPFVYWNISNDVPSVLVIHVQWLSMNGMLDMLSKLVEKELILLFLL